MFELSFTAIGTATPKGSVTAFVPKRKDGSIVTRANGDPMVVAHDQTSKRGKVWAEIVSSTAFEALVQSGQSMTRSAALEVQIEFYLQRPKNHYRTGKYQHLLRPDAPAAPCTMPDVDKLVRGVLDAMSNVVYGDDGQIAAVSARKHFGSPPRAEVRVTPYSPTSAEPLPPVDERQMTLA